MDTRLKKLTKWQQELVMLVSWSMWMAFECLVRLHSVYAKAEYEYSYLTRSKFKIFVTIGTIAGILAAAALVYVTVRYLKKYLLMRKLTPIKADTWKLEWVVLVEAVAAFIWYKSVHIPWYNPYIWSGLKVDDVNSVILYLLVMTGLSALLAAGAWILVRRILNRSWDETSLICQRIRKYKLRTPVEKQIAHRNKFLLISFVAVLAAGMICSILGYAYDDDFFIAGIGLEAVGFVVFFIAFFKNRFYKDLMRLTHQIDAMAEGVQTSEAAVLSEDSPLYETAVKLDDIETAMKRSMEKQVQAERLKIDLVTNVSHDLKTPLTSMIGYTDLLKKELLSNEAKDYLEVISSKQEQLKDMIQDLFDLAKSTSRTEQLQLERLDMKRLVKQITADMGDRIEKSGKEIRTTFSEEDTLFTGDNRKMYRVVQNLMENALKYSLEGTRIYIEVERKAEEVCLSMKNISSYEMTFTPEEILERFNRGDKARTTEGHGLGLAIASSFAGNMGGTMKVEVDGDLFKVILTFPAAE